MDPEQAFSDAAIRRILRLMLTLGALGCLACLILRGWTWAAGFLAGAAASYLNFHWLKKLVDSLGAPAATRPNTRLAVLIGLRYLLLAAGGYAILNFTNLSLPAALTGLFVPVAAVIVEILYELIYART